MSVYLVSYDLNKPEQDYQRLIDAICGYTSSCRVLKSQWLILTNETAKQISDHLTAFIDSNDELFVCELNQNCEGRLNLEVIKWLRNFHKATPLLPKLLG